MAWCHVGLSKSNGYTESLCRTREDRPACSDCAAEGDDSGNRQTTPADFTRMLELLHDAKYRGYVVLEYEEKEEPYDAIPTFVKQVRKTLSDMN